jgi:hypothetical protein
VVTFNYTPVVSSLILDKNNIYFGASIFEANSVLSKGIMDFD